jgi:hypothetical protein
MLLLLMLAGFILFALLTDRSGTKGWTIGHRIRRITRNLADDTGAWSASGGFAQFFTDYFNNTNAFWTPALPNLNLETHKVALYGNGGTPNFDDTAAHNAYNGSGGAWVTANEASGTGYSAGGTLLLNTAVSSVSGGITMWDADDTAWTTISVTAYGALLYADSLSSPVADQGIMAVYFGGAFTTTLGNLTIQWSANGVYRDDNA